MAALGIKLDISIQGMEDLLKFRIGSVRLRRLTAYPFPKLHPVVKKRIGKNSGIVQHMPTIQKYEDAFTKTDPGRLETLHAQKKNIRIRLVNSARCFSPTSNAIDRARY